MVPCCGMEHICGRCTVTVVLVEWSDERCMNCGCTHGLCESGKGGWAKGHISAFSRKCDPTTACRAPVSGGVPVLMCIRLVFSGSHESCCACMHSCISPCSSCIPYVAIREHQTAPPRDLINHQITHITRVAGQVVQSGTARCHPSPQHC